jgi:hypothetical protein
MSIPEIHRKLMEWVWGRKEERGGKKGGGQGRDEEGEEGKETR